MSETTKIIVMFLAAFEIMLLLAPAGLPLLRRLKFGQTVRNEGPQTHLAKNGTPTMGGIMIMIAFTIPCIFFIKDYEEIFAPCVIAILFGFVGFLDDYLKVKRKKSEGLKPWQKMGLQIIFTVAIIVFLYFFSDISPAIKVPFIKDVEFNIGWWVLPLNFVAILGTDTGANFTDGLDGLVSKVTIVILIFLFFAARMQGSALVYPIAAFSGALLSFLLFNAHPARVFM